MYPHACCVLSRFSHVWLFATPWAVARQAPLSMGFSTQEYWSGLSCSPHVCIYIYIYVYVIYSHISGRLTEGCLRSTTYMCICSWILFWNIQVGQRSLAGTVHRVAKSQTWLRDLAHMHIPMASLRVTKNNHLISDECQSWNSERIIKANKYSILEFLSNQLSH